MLNLPMTGCQSCDGTLRHLSKTQMETPESILEISSRIYARGDIVDLGDKGKWHRECYVPIKTKVAEWDLRLYDREQAKSCSCGGCTCKTNA